IDRLHTTAESHDRVMVLEVMGRDAGFIALHAGVAGTADSNTAPADASSGRTINVTLKFASDSWVEVYDANGAKLFYDIGAASSSHKLTGIPPLRVTFGNAPGVRIEVNGKRARVPANAVENDTAQFTINRSGRLVRASGPGDGG
ncbi:MAG: RodZ domain-containing protein, partial [Gammaproteobacteria bacterium]